MKQNKNYIMQSAVALLTASLALTACNDTWDDHYDPAVSANGTIWQALQGNPNLTNFTKVVKACGYDQTLNGSQTFSVFAPVDADFTADKADQLIASYNEQKSRGVKDNDNSVIRQFLQNHITLYNHPVSSLTNDSITMMNGKYQVLTSSTIGATRLESSNALYSNGVLFTINKQMEYFPNVFEYLALDADVDSAYNFLESYNVYKFDADKSVAGGIEDGKVVYLDSVMVMSNTLFDYYGEINTEDSTYWMVVPTNTEWNRMVAQYEPYFMYDNTVNKRDSMQFANSRLSILRGAIFSMSENNEQAMADSVMSTMAYSYEARKYYEQDYPYGLYYKPYAEGGVFSGVQSVECSNGKVMKAASFNIKPEQTFLQTIKIEAENSMMIDSVSNAIDPVTVRRVSNDNPFYNKVSGNAFIEVIPKDNNSNPSVFLKVPDVLANMKYDVYVVMAPALAYDTLATAENRMSTRMQCKMEYPELTGKSNSETLKLNNKTTFEPKEDVVDTVLVAENFKFPACSFGLSEAKVHLQLSSRVTSSQTNKYTRTLRIDCLILKPHAEATDEAAKTYSWR